MRFLHYIWDFDGTLFDTYPAMAKVFQGALREFGVEADEREVYRQIKRSVGAAARHYLNGDVPRAEALTARFAEAQRAAIAPEDMKLFPGAAELLCEIAREGGRSYLYTHRDDSAFGALEIHGLRGLFADAITSLDHFPNKPAPDALLALCARNGIDPARALMLGDRSIDVLAGRSAGMAGCLFDPDGLYEDFDEPLRAKSFNELQHILLGRDTREDAIE